MIQPTALMAHALMPSVWLKLNAKAKTARERQDLNLLLKPKLRLRPNLRFTAKPRFTARPKLKPE